MSMFTESFQKNIETKENYLSNKNPSNYVVILKNFPLENIENHIKHEEISQIYLQKRFFDSAGKRKWWTKEEAKNWKKIASFFSSRTDVQCLHRWQKVLNPNLVKGPWTKKEDEIIRSRVEKYGPKNWSMIAKELPGRIGKQCRERWHNHLNPDIKKDKWSEEEDLTIIEAKKK